MTRTLSAHIEDWKFRAPIRITGHVFRSIQVLVVEIAENGVVGRGEASGVYYLDDTPAGALEQVLALELEIAHGLGRGALQRQLPAGGARNALDCALWDLDCQLARRTVWDQTGLAPAPQLTVQTIGIQDEPEDVARLANALTDAPILKLKLDGDRPAERVRAVREARPSGLHACSARRMHAGVQGVRCRADRATSASGRRCGARWFRVTDPPLR
jgi:L-alanine-DL-glutamate epimerase-like enolase superfamily enzyme